MRGARILACFMLFQVASFSACAEEWVELRPETLFYHLDLVGTVLGERYGEGYLGNPLVRTDAYIGYGHRVLYMLVVHDSVCTSEGCPLLTYELGDFSVESEPLMEQRVYHRVLDSFAVVHVDGQYRRLYADPSRSDHLSFTGMPVLAVMESRYGEVLEEGLRVDLSRLYVADVDLNNDGEYEVLLYVPDPDRDCDGFWPDCESAVFQRMPSAPPGRRTVMVGSEQWVDIGSLGIHFIPCRGGGNCLSVLVLDETVEGYRSIIGGRNKHVWNPAVHRYDWIELDGFPIAD